jgi:hypothetical protein
MSFSAPLTLPLQQLIRAEVQQRVNLMPSPAPDFDALRAGAAELARHGLPRRPDPARSPALHAFWERMFSPPVRFIGPELDFDLTLRHLLRRGATGGEAGAMAFTPTRWGTSRNWSGAVITARDGMLFRSVAGRWTVPAPAAPRNANTSQPPPGDAWQGSVWLGLDGYRRWSRSLPQMGTVSVVDAAEGVLKPGTYVFAQWWVRGKTYGEVRIPNMPVKAGDDVSCLLTAEGPTEVNFAMTNHTQKASIALSWKQGQVETDATMLNRSDAPVEGRNAVWCVERPLTLPKGQQAATLFSLPRIGPVDFVDVVAEMHDPADAAAPPVMRDLTAARLLRMIGDAGQAAQPGTSILVSPTAPAGGGGRLQVRQR